MKITSTRKILPINDIKPYTFNPRENDGAVEGVMESIKKEGYHRKIVVDGNHVIIAGHTRYKALTRLGYEEIEVDIVEPELSSDKTAFDIEMHAFRIIDNVTNEGSGYTEKVDNMVTSDSLLAYFFEVPEANLDVVDAREEIAKETTGDKVTELICPDCGEIIPLQL